MLLPRLLLSLAAAICGVWAQETAPIERNDVQGIPLRTHSLSAPYLDTDMQSRWWDFGGSTIIRADQYVRLTSDRPSQSGYLFSRVPLTATNWEVEVEFRIKGKGNLYGDGLAMWVTKERATQGDVFGSVDKFEGLGIFFDTYKNNRPGTTFPYIMAMVGDGNTEYAKGTDGKENELAGCSARGIRNAAIPTKAKITYFQDQNLVLQLQYKNEKEWLPCFDIPNVKVPSVAYLGFSAETGELSDNHDIIKVSTKNLYDGSARSNVNRKQAEFSRGKGRAGNAAATKKPSSGGGWSWFLFKVVAFFAVCGGGYIGFTIYRARKRSSRF